MGAGVVLGRKGRNSRRRSPTAESSIGDRRYNFGNRRSTLQLRRSETAATVDALGNGQPRATIPCSLDFGKKNQTESSFLKQFRR